MTPKQEAQLKKLGPFTLAEARQIGISHQELSILVKEEKVNRMEWGIYLHPTANIPREIDFQIAYKKFGPNSAIGGLTALFHYNLAEQVPKQTWVLVPPEKRVSSRKFRIIRTKTPLNMGIIEGNGYRIVSIERAIVEAFKLSSKMGERTAIHACRVAIQQRQTTLKKIGMMAKELGLTSYFNKYSEAIIGSLQ
jgi:predicted transcriptional regulator of viral defense system